MGERQTGGESKIQKLFVNVRVEEEKEGDKIGRSFLKSNQIMDRFTFISEEEVL